MLLQPGSKTLLDFIKEAVLSSEFINDYLVWQLILNIGISMDILDRFLKKPYMSLSKSNYRVVHTFTMTLVLITLLLTLVIIIGNASSSNLFLINAVILYNVFLFVLICSGYFRLSVPLLFLGLGIMSTLVVFNRSSVNHYEIYMLTTFHISLLFISTIISYRMIYVYAGAGFALCMAVLHFFLRELPSVSQADKVTSNLDDYIICMGLVIISCFIINNSFAYKSNLFRYLKRQSDANRDKAKKLSEINAKLMKSVNERDETEKKYRLLVETATDAIFIAQDQVIKFPNKKTLEILGYTEKELGDIPFVNHIHENDKKQVIERHQMRLKGEEPPHYYSFRIFSKSGEERWVQLSTALTLWEEKPATLNFMRDITLQKKLEIQIQNSQKMEAIGTLAGGIAHDFNNILSGVFAFSQLAKKHINDPDKSLKYIEQLDQAAQKAANLTLQILSVSKKNMSEKKPILVQKEVSEALDLLRATIPATIEINEQLDSGSMVLSDDGKIHQVIINICTNAYHSMEETGGVLEIQLKDTTIGSKHTIPELNVKPGNYSLIKISDTGVGINEKTLTKIFEPYFTTKKKDKGTGLGLAVAHGIIREHEGFINVNSEPGKGSCFNIYLPVTEIKPEIHVPDDEEIEILEGSEKIMLVDDEESILISTRDILEDYGYHVSVFSNGMDALSEYKQNPEKYDLIITDMTMPHMTGVELVQHIFKLTPEQPVFLCTGHSELINKMKAKQMGILRYLEKPIHTHHMLTHIRKTLDKKNQI